MIKSFKYSSKRASSQHWDNLIFIGYCISNWYFCISFWICKILNTSDSSVSYKVNFKVFCLLSFKMSKFFVNTFSRCLKFNRSLRFNSLFSIPNLIQSLIKIVILLRRNFLAYSSSSDYYFVYTCLFLCWMTRWNCYLYYIFITFSVTIRLVLILFFVMFLIVNDSRGCFKRRDYLRFISSNAGSLPSLSLD